MAVLKTALVLVHVVVSILAWENIPAIPANRRAQYYLQHDDGGYKYGYDTGEGHSGQATADAANQVQGEYSYVDGEGQRVNLQYTAGDGGFVPVLRGSASRGAVAKASGFSSRAHSVNAGVNAASQDPDYDENADASYSFGFDTDSYKRTESSDSKGNIQGQYSYNSPVGGSHAISYIAGEGTGFVVTSDASSGAPSSAPASGYSYPAPAHSPASAYDGQTQLGPDGSFSFAYSTADHSHQAAADAQNNVRGSYSFVSHDDGQTRKVDYQAGSATGFVATGAHLPVAPSVPAAHSSLGAAHSSLGASPYSPPRPNAGGEPSNANTVINPDGSFSYSYSTADHSKHETADANNNVRGSFTFKAKDDGKIRKVDYIAGADTGFVASGDHLPVAPSPAGGAGYNSVASQASAFGHSSNSYSGGSAAASSTNNAQSDGSYAFSYQTDDHSHHAAADSQGNVAGSFSFVAKDGVSRKIDYTAGAETGFVAKGDHLPVAPPIPAPAPGVVGAPASPSAGGGYQYSAPSSNAFSGDSESNSDGSYSYSYDAGSSSKQESADAQGNVMGSFSFLGGDGVNRQLTYTARGDQGFIAQGDHLPVPPAVAPGHSTGLASHNAFAHPDLFTGSAAAKSASSSSSGSVMASKEGAYSYSYKTGGHGSSGSAFKSSSAGQNNFGGAAKPYSSPAASGSHGAATGHVKASKDGAYSYSYSTGGQSAASSNAASGHGAVNPYSSGAGALSAGSQANDGSYSFSYDAGTHSHEQSADANNNVRGSFSFKAKDDGQVRKVDYTAGSATGFLAKGAHLPVAPVAGGVAPSAHAPFSGARLAGSSSVASGYDASQDNGDGSYSYSYKTDSSSKEETADAKGNVVGSFSFVGGDGVNRKLTYTAKNDEGFNAAGDHLPVAPLVAGSSSQFGAKSTASSSSSQSHRFSSSQSGALPASTSHLSHADGNIVISKYLPPESPHKFGYIFDTKA